DQTSLRQVSCGVEGILRSRKDFTLDVERSRVTVCCIADLDGPPSDIALANAAGITNDGADAPIPRNGVHPSHGSAFLAGFTMGFPNDHHVFSARAGATFRA